MQGKLWLALAVLAAVAVPATTPLLGSGVQSELRALDAEAAIGGVTPLEVAVPPHLLDGLAELYVVAEDGAQTALGEFRLRDLNFVLEAPVPPIGKPGQIASYRFVSYAADGCVFEWSTSADVVLAASSGTDEPPIWD